MDKTGNNGNPSDGKPTRNQNVVCKTKGRTPKKEAATNDTQWTTQGFTTLDRRAVLFVIIIKKAGQLNFNDHYGFDIIAPWTGEDKGGCVHGRLPM